MAMAMAVVGLGATVAGGIIQAEGAKSKAAGIQRMNQYQAGVARENANVMRQNADYALNKGGQEAIQYGMRAKQIAGQIRANRGASGVDVNTGSSKDVMDSQRTVTELDMTQIRSNAAKQAYDFNVQAYNYERQAGLYEIAGSNAVEAGKWEAMSSYVGTVGSVSSKWMQASSMGMFGGGSNNSAFYPEVFGGAASP